MKLLDLIFKTENPTKEVLVDDIISSSSTKAKKTQKDESDKKPIQSERLTNLNFNNINVYSPQNREEIEKIIINLQKNEASIINLKGYEKLSLNRILDFLFGAVFALKGNINKLTKDLYLISPQNLKIKVLK